MALWAKNNVVTNLTNCYQPAPCAARGGVNCQMRGDNGKQDQHLTPVKILMQTKWYVNAFSEINKKNMKDAVFDLKGNSK